MLVLGNISYFDGHSFVLHGWIDEHDEWLFQNWLVFIVFHQLSIVREELSDFRGDLVGREVKTDQAFFWIHFFMEFQHFS